jgi:hypothetical protein
LIHCGIHPSKLRKDNVTCGLIALQRLVELRE